MERKLFVLLMQGLRTNPQARRRPSRGIYTNHAVLAVALWAALHDRPISWAVCRENWPVYDRIRPLPSSATMSRRLRDPIIAEIMNRLLASMRVRGKGERTLIIDGRALQIARHSADTDAAFGRAAGGMGKGYKLHAIVDLLGNCRGFRVEPLNISEQAVACDLIKEIGVDDADVLLADGNYDANVLYELAGERGVQLFAARRYRHARSLGHRQHSEHRRRALKLMEADPSLLDQRRVIESCFGIQGNTIGGLGPLPNHIRRLARVRRWVTLKLAIDAAHRCQRQEKKAR